MSVKANLEAVAQKMYGKGIKDLADHDLYFAILQMTKEMMENKGRIQGSKKVYYISAEFLIGKLLSNNLINLGIYDDVAAFLKENGKAIADSSTLPFLVSMQSISSCHISHYLLEISLCCYFRIST